MHIDKQPLQIVRSFGIAAGLFLALALGAISFFFRPIPAGLGEATAQLPKPATTTGEVLEKAEPLPPDYLEICRAAGI
jgi:hypothetical protein